jgi:hypothetical protein
MYILPSNQRIINIFYNEILPIIANGDNQTAIHFNTEIHENEKVEYAGGVYDENLPTMIIRSKEMFNHYLIELMKEIYDTGIPLRWKDSPSYIRDKTGFVNEEKNHLKYYLTNVWANMTYKDLENPEAYMRRYKSFLDDTTFKHRKIEFDLTIKNEIYHAKIITVEKECKSETPYAFRMEIYDESTTWKYIMPDVKFGIEDTPHGKVAYIYAIQNNREVIVANDENNKRLSEKNYKEFLLFKSKVESYMRRVDKYLPKEEYSKIGQAKTYESGFEENISDVTPSFTIALTAALSIFVNSEITDVIVPSSFPIRRESVRIFDEEDIELTSRKKHCSNEEINKLKEEYESKRYRDEQNITDKMIRNFRRLAYHFGGINIMSFPFDFDIDDNMYVKLNDDLMPNNPEHVLAEVARGVSDYYQRGNKLR